MSTKGNARDGRPPLSPASKSRGEAYRPPMTLSSIPKFNSRALILAAAPTVRMNSIPMKTIVDNNGFGKAIASMAREAAVSPAKGRSETSGQPMTLSSTKPKLNSRALLLAAVPTIARPAICMKKIAKNGFGKAVAQMAKKKAAPTKVKRGISRIVDAARTRKEAGQPTQKLRRSERIAKMAAIAANTKFLKKAKMETKATAKSI